MRNYEEFENYRVLGAAIQPTVVTGFGNFSILASRVLLDEKLGKDDGKGVATFDPNEWCPLKNWLRACDRISNEYGEYILRQMGNSVPQHVPFPPSIADVESALFSVDVAYHMNHSKNGVPMFSPQTGEMQEGIGHYLCKRTPARKEIVCVCDSLYPCAFDEGLLQAMAQRFNPTATLTHQPGSCRKRGNPSCTYVVTWK
jgi:hypothetical protein